MTGEPGSEISDGRPEVMRGFRELRVWQAAMDLTEIVYGLTRSFPKYETYGLASQMQRAAVSVAANIAEGHTRHHLGEYLHHISIARASLAELQTHLELTRRLAYAPEIDVLSYLAQSASLAKQLNALRNSLAARQP